MHIFHLECHLILFLLGFSFFGGRLVLGVGFHGRHFFFFKSRTRKDEGHLELGRVGLDPAPVVERLLSGALWPIHFSPTVSGSNAFPGPFASGKP
jgi:hypothetical protein